MDRQRRLDLLERRVADGLFYLLLGATLLLAGWLSARQDHYWDWTGSSRNTLSAASAGVVASLDGPLRVTVFIPRDHPSAKRIEPLLARYSNAGARLEITYLDPQLYPEQAREAQISVLGQMLLEYRNRRETVKELGETYITGAIARLARAQRPWVLFLEGHGERAIDDDAGSQYGRFGRVLRERGYRLLPLDLASQAQIPMNTDLLVISTPEIALFPGEAQRLIDYVNAGGNLLWLMDPGDLNGLEPVADVLGITPLPGRLVDANVRRLNIEDPTVAMIENYPDHPLTRGLRDPGLLPGSRAYLPVAGPEWTLENPLQTLENSWNETGPVRGEIARDGDLGEQPGPLPVALALSRQHDNGERQRVLIVGDGDFASNAHLRSGGNLSLGLRMVQWLTEPEGAEGIDPVPLPDRQLRLDRDGILMLGGGALVLSPLLFLAVGLVVRRWRSRG